MIDATPEIGFEDIVRHRAYALWESEGRPFGRDTEHWRVCEELIRAELAAPSPKKVARKAASRKKAAPAPQRAVAYGHSASL